MSLDVLLITKRVLVNECVILHEDNAVHQDDLHYWLQGKDMIQRQNVN